MIDFRYHLISIIAVLLALSIGVVLGSGLLGEPLLDDLERNVSELEERNRDYRTQIDDLSRRISSQEDFVDAVAPYALAGSLDGEDIVLLTFEDTSGGAVDQLVEAVEIAGGTVMSRIEFTNKMELGDDLARDELGLVIGSVTSRVGPLRIEAARLIGARARVAAAADRGGLQRANALFAELEEAGFVAVDRDGTVDAVPEGARFLVAAGSKDPPGYETGLFVRELGMALAAEEESVMVGEVAESAWGVVTAVLEDGAAREVISTVEGIDEETGRIAAVLGFAAALEGGDAGHYGLDSEAEDGFLPPPPAAP